MEAQFKERFLENWTEYFPGADLPIAFYYTNSEEPKGKAGTSQKHRCVIGDLAKARKGRTLSLDRDTVGCFGGRRYLGFDSRMAPNFEYFLSCGIPGQLEGERYKKSPGLVKEIMKSQRSMKAPGKQIIFKRLDRMGESDHPLVVIFFASPDVLSGLFTLANFAETDPNGVIAPFGAGCASIVDYPYRELESPRPRAVLGMFDVSARPCVPSDELTFAVPWPKFVGMVNDMKESFLVTKSWNSVRARIKKRLRTS